jgi:hypothetical protein
MGEWLKPAVLKTDPAPFRKCKKNNPKPLAGQHLQPFSVSPDFTHLY